MAKHVFERFDAHKMTDTLLDDAAKLFTENYGIWGEDPTNPTNAPKRGIRMKLSKTRLRAQHLPAGALCSYVRVTFDDRLAGNAFACRWRYEDKTVCWVTQPVVHRDFRQRGLVSGLLNHLRQDDDSIYGVMSSHPATCLAAAKAFRSAIESVSVSFIRDHADAVIKASPISYVKDAVLHGSLFDSNDTSGVVSSVDTNFFVDHTEPLKALTWIRERR